MMPVYIGVAALIVVIILIFGGMKWAQKHALDIAQATPSPGPNASAKPIALVDGGTIGVQHFPVGNTRTGGTGQPIDGLTCLAQEGTSLHVHAHVALFDRGKQIQIPRYIGFAPNPQLPGGGCLYWIHTHDASGIIHVEAPDLHPPGGGPYTLGMLFDIWGQPLGADNIAGFKGPVTAYVNGAKYDGDLRAIPLSAHQEITLEVGHPHRPRPLVFLAPQRLNSAGPVPFDSDPGGVGVGSEKKLERTSRESSKFFFRPHPRSTLRLFSHASGTNPSPQLHTRSATTPPLRILYLYRARQPRGGRRLAESWVRVGSKKKLELSREYALIFFSTPPAPSVQRKTFCKAAARSSYEISPVLRYATFLSLPMIARVGKAPCR